MAEFSANAVQTVAPGETVVFTESVSSCPCGLVRHRDGSGSFLLAGRGASKYLVDFGANIAVPTGGTVGEISLAIAIDGDTVPATTMTVTPAAVEEFFNVARSTALSIWKGCCETVSIRNVSDQAILVQNAGVRISLA